MLNYNKNNIQLAKSLRKNMTSQEKKLWHNFLKNYPVRFQRQKTIDNYIVDFYCAKARLVIELDGGGHYSPEQIEYDKERTMRLNNYNLNVIRINNNDINNYFDDVCCYIDRLVKDSMN